MIVRVFFSNRSSQPQAELFINYKRALSPIPEEDEDEESTCKTFIMNDTKCLDSTRYVESVENCISSLFLIKWLKTYTFFHSQHGKHQR